MMIGVKRLKSYLRRCLSENTASMRALILMSLLMGLYTNTYALEDNRYAFVQMGQVKLDETSAEITIDDEVYEGSFDDLPLFAGGVQTLKGDGYFRYGYEAGGLLTWQNDTVAFYGTNNTVGVVVDNQFWMFSGFLGGMAEINFKEHVRMFVSAGPLLGFASIAQDDDVKIDDDPDTRDTYVNGQKRDLSWVYGAYASTGIVVNIAKAEVGLVYREQLVEVDFSTDITGVEYDGRQIMLSIGYKMPSY